MNAPVALLCPGPSLPQVWREDLFQTYGRVVAVNTAGWFFRHHWFVATDDAVLVPSFMDEKPVQPLHGYVVPPAWQDRIAWAQNGRWAFRPLHTVFAPEQGTPNQPRYGYTFPNALEFALGLSPGGVDCYGVDYAVGKDGVHRLPGDDHSENRFAQEAAQVRDVIRRHEHRRDRSAGIFRGIDTNPLPVDFVTFAGTVDPRIVEYLQWRRHEFPRMHDHPPMPPATRRRLALRTL